MESDLIKDMISSAKIPLIGVALYIAFATSFNLIEQANKTKEKLIETQKREKQPMKDWIIMHGKAVRTETISYVRIDSSNVDSAVTGFIAWAIDREGERIGIVDSAKTIKELNENLEKILNG